MTLMCVYVFVSVCLLVVMCWMFLWEWGLCERRELIVRPVVCGAISQRSVRDGKSNTQEDSQPGRVSTFLRKETFTRL